MDTKTQQVESVNEKLHGDFKIDVVPVEELELLEKNARYMKNEQFQNLVENIKRDGGISSIPFCYLQPNGKYKVLSGNHRTEAARAAGLEEIPIMYTDKELTKDEQLAIQLSHNSIAGEDDPVILQELYEEIEDLNLKYYAGLDDKLLEQLDEVQIDGITEAQLDYTSISFLFLPNEVERLLEVFDEAVEMASSEDAILARFSEYDKLLDNQEKVKGSYNIHNGATALMIILDIFQRHQEDLQEGWLGEDYEAKHNSWVPLSSVIGTDDIPAESLGVIKRAVDKMMSQGDITKENKWQALEYLAAEYLGG